MIFRLLGLRWRFRCLAVNRGRNGGMWAYTPNAYRRQGRGAV